MSIFRSTRRQRQLAALLAPYTVTQPIGPAAEVRWPIDHGQRCRCSYCN